jgi:hypothetical protein
LSGHDGDAEAGYRRALGLHAEHIHARWAQAMASESA